MTATMPSAAGFGIFESAARFMVNVSTEFKTTGTFPVNRPPPSAAGGISYDDGFVGVDKTGNSPLPGTPLRDDILGL